MISVASPTLTMSLASISTELLENIIGNIDLPIELLNLALTSRSFHSLIVPNHIQFRDIRCSINQRNLWKLLIEKPLLASNIRVLHLVIHRKHLNATIESPRLPAILTGWSSSDGLGPQHSAGIALKSMKSLNQLVIMGTRFVYIEEYKAAIDDLLPTIIGMDVPLQALGLHFWQWPHDIIEKPTDSLSFPVSRKMVQYSQAFIFLLSRSGHYQLSPNCKPGFATVPCASQLSIRSTSL